MTINRTVGNGIKFGLTQFEHSVLEVFLLTTFHVVVFFLYDVSV